MADRGGAIECHVYWGSHGCGLPHDHAGDHLCDCGESPWDDAIFYGEDAVRLGLPVSFDEWCAYNWLIDDRPWVEWHFEDSEIERAACPWTPVLDRAPDMIEAIIGLSKEPLTPHELTWMAYPNGDGWTAIRVEGPKYKPGGVTPPLENP